MPSDSRLTPAAAKPAKRSASAELGLASRVISRSGATGPVRFHASISAATVSGGISDGVPPPKKIEHDLAVRRQRGLAARDRRAARRVQRASSIRSRTWLLKSQYGHFDRQNGQWM